MNEVERYAHQLSGSVYRITVPYTLTDKENSLIVMGQRINDTRNTAIRAIVV